MTECLGHGTTAPPRESCVVPGGLGFFLTLPTGQPPQPSPRAHALGYICLSLRAPSAVPGGLGFLFHATHGSTTPTRATLARVGDPGETVGYHLPRPMRSGCARLPNIPSPTKWDERA